jgi:tetratricopeptide (TPR) repeat protein
MPHADPTSSFQAAVRHLFRHLNDLAELRRNPLALPTIAAVQGWRSPNSALAEIRGRILEEAGRCSAKDRADGLTLRADREHAIVSAICGSESPEATYTRLGLSRRQYYRHRNAVCSRVARALSSQHRERDRTLAVADPLELLLRRAATLRDTGFARTAVGLLESALTTDSLAPESITVRLALAEASLSLGDQTRAGDLLHVARAHMEAMELDRPELRLPIRAALVEVKLAMVTGRDRDARKAMSLALMRQTDGNYADDLALETLVGYAYFACCDGAYPEARSILKKIRELARRQRPLVPDRAAAIALLEAHCVIDSAGEIGGMMPHLEEALSISLKHGLIRRALEAMSSIASCSVLEGRDDRIYDLAKRALALARTAEGHELLSSTVVWMSPILAISKYWRALNPLLFEAESVVRPNTAAWQVLKLLQGQYLTRAGRYEEARPCLTEALQYASRFENPRLEAVTLRDLGTTLAHLGRIDESADALRRAIGLAERHTSVLTRFVTYKAAAAVLKDPRITRRAEELQKQVNLVIQDEHRTSDENAREPELTLSLTGN